VEVAAKRGLTVWSCASPTVIRVSSTQSNRPDLEVAKGKRVCEREGKGRR
jgi:hypothetical protein